MKKEYICPELEMNELPAASVMNHSDTDIDVGEDDAY